MSPTSASATPEASGVPHVPVLDEPAQQVDGAVPVAVVEVGAGQQVVRAGLGGGDGVQQDVDGLVGPAGLEQRDAGRGQPAQGARQGWRDLGERGPGGVGGAAVIGTPTSLRMIEGYPIVSAHPCRRHRIEGS